MRDLDDLEPQSVRAWRCRQRKEARGLKPIYAWIPKANRQALLREAIRRHLPLATIVNEAVELYVYGQLLSHPTGPGETTQPSPAAPAMPVHPTPPQRGPMNFRDTLKR